MTRGMGSRPNLKGTLVTGLVIVVVTMLFYLGGEYFQNSDLTNMGNALATFLVLFLAIFTGLYAIRRQDI